MFLGLATREKLIISYHTGKRGEDNTDVFVKDLARWIDGRIPILVRFTRLWAAPPPWR